jgi:acyl carrier protein
MCIDEKLFFESVSDIANIPVDDIKETDSLVSLGIDSLGLVDLIVRMEKDFGVEFDDSSLNPSKLICLKDVVEVLKNTKGGKGG